MRADLLFKIALCAIGTFVTPTNASIFQDKTASSADGIAGLRVRAYSQKKKPSSLEDDSLIVSVVNVSEPNAEETEGMPFVLDAHILIKAGGHKEIKCFQQEGVNADVEGRGHMFKIGDVRNYQISLAHLDCAEPLSPAKKYSLRLVLFPGIYRLQRQPVSSNVVHITLGK
jgi:hypothetical protein